MWTLSIFCLFHSSLDIVQKIQKPIFQNLESLSRSCILILNGAQKFKFPGFWFSTLVGCFYTLKIKKKRGSSINLDIHHSKVTSSDRLDLGLHLLQYYCTMYFSSWLSNLLSKCKLNIWSKLCKYICICCLYIIYLK